MSDQASRVPKDAPITLNPIGYVERTETEDNLPGPELRARSTRIVLNPHMTDALLGLEPGTDIIVLCYFHQAQRDVLRVHPMGNRDNPLRGVFATRSPARPNPIAITSARIQRIDGHILEVVGLDALDGTPVIDIKPHAETFDTPYRSASKND